MNLSKHFTLAEAVESDIATRKSIDNTPSDTVIANMVKTAAGLEEVRALLGEPMIINSWFRSLLLNRAIGSSDTSDHRQGWAVDFKCKSIAPIKVCEAIVQSDIQYDQLIFEGTWTHISFSPKMRNQILTAVFKPGKKAVYLKGLVA